MEDLSVILISSPYASRPDLSIISQVIDSLSILSGCENLSVTILLDGCFVDDGKDSRMKKGRITEEMFVRYNQYHETLLATYLAPKYTIHRSSEHKGFAFMVKWGLDLCTTTYALILQHDRCFIGEKIDYIPLLLQYMERYDFIRYIGFPSINNITHDRLLETTYHLEILNRYE